MQRTDPGTNGDETGVSASPTETRHASSERWLGAAILLTLAAAAALEAYGFVSERLFAQAIWLDVGLQRLVEYTVVFGLIVAGIIVFFRRWLLTLALLTAAGGAVVAVGALPLLSVLFMLVSADALGHLVFGDDGSEERALLNVLSGIALLVFAMTFLVRVRVNYAPVYVAALTLPLLFDRRRTMLRLRRRTALLSDAPHLPLAYAVALAVLAYVVGMHWLLVLKPEVSTDSLAMHLAIPAGVAMHHVMPFEPSRFVWAVMPMTADYAYTAAYMLGGEAASRLLNLTVFLLLLGLLYSALRRSTAPAAALLGTACFASTPLTSLVTGSLFVENFQAAMIFGAATGVWLFWESGLPRDLLTAALLGGTAVATKLGSVSFVVCLLPFAIAASLRHRRARAPLPVSALWLASFVLVVAAVPPYAIAWWKTGNPVFPFLNARFRSPYFEPIDFVDTRFLEPIRWRTLFDLTFRTNSFYEGQKGSFGFQHLVLVPLAAFAAFASRRPAVLSSAVLGIAGGILVLRSVPNARYVYPALPLLIVPAAALVGGRRSRSVSSGAMAVACSACIALNAYFFASSGWYHKDFFLPFSAEAKEAYVRELAPIRPVIDYMNREHPGSDTLLTSSTAIAGLSGNVYEAQWHQWRIQHRLLAAKDLGEIVQVLKGWNVRYLIASDDAASGTTAPILAALVDRCATQEFRVANVSLRRLEPTCPHIPPGLASVGARAKAAGITGALSFSPIPVRLCSRTGLGRATVAWRVMGASVVEVHVSAPDGPLFARAGESGSQDTGEWVTRGTTFYLQNAAGGVPRTLENTIARASVTETIAVACD